MTQRRLWLTFTIGFTLSIIGAIVLFTPSLEFAAVDVIEKLHLPIGFVGNLAIYAELTLFTLSTLGLLTLTIRHFLNRRSL